MSRAQPEVVVLVGPDAADPPALDLVESHAHVQVVRELAQLRAAVVGGAEILAVYDFRTSLVRELGDDARSLSWVHAASAGVDAALAPAVADAGIVVTNAQGVFDRPIAEYVLGLLLSFCKDLPRTLALQRDRTWKHRETRSFAGRRVLIVGAGSIGSEVARLTLAVGAEVRGIASTRRPHELLGSLHPVDELDDHLAWADDVVVCLPLNDGTRGLFDAGRFEAMRPGATFVNIGRGPVVVERDLVDALHAGRVSAAGLDVFEVEPLPDDSPLWSLDNVVVSPHMSGDEEGWEAALTRQFAENLERWRAGDPLDHVVQGGPR